MGTMTMRRLDRRRTSVLGLLAYAVACNGGGNNEPPPIDLTATDANPTASATGTATDVPGTGTGSSGTGADTSGTTGPVVTNCEDLVCTGNGSCEVGQNGMAYCACDPGYKLDESGEACIVDESCVQLRFLEDRCRQIYNGAPAVSLFFAVDFCAGTAVLPEKLVELGLDFKVLENGVDIEDNVESFSTVIPKPVESYVDLVIDVSDSITSSQDLPTLVTELRALVTSLTPGADEPDVYVAIHVFARDSAEYVPFTRDLAAVDAALAAIAVDPTPVVQLAGNGNGTDLYDAVQLGINRTQRIRDLRNAVTWGGVLSTGTVVVVTDGNDTSNGMLDTSLIKNTTNNVISIGISGEVVNESLQAIGRDGSFLAPVPADWPGAFAEITQRVDEYPARSYLLAYCSSATEGAPEVEIAMTGAVEVVSTAICQFDADVFSTDPADACEASLFATECGAQNCGGLTACGACADDECCDGYACQAPQTATAEGIANCGGQDDLCAAADEICGLSGLCVPPEPINTGTCGAGCEPGVGRCVAGECIPVLTLGAVCEEPTDCPELNCQRENPENPFQDHTCLPEARLYDTCGMDDAICEAGGYCQSVCLPRKLDAEGCNGSDECRTASCVSFEGAGNRCAGFPVCFWSWDEKVPA
jgi:hypothetical protein